VAGRYVGSEGKLGILTLLMRKESLGEVTCQVMHDALMAHKALESRGSLQL
jgi:hypothetical protein